MKETERKEKGERCSEGKRVINRRGRSDGRKIGEKEEQRKGTDGRREGGSEEKEKREGGKEE